ncbi:hypothetical protein I79_015307 [Cricetulus griseus]|uniref:Uncharacterized protein n=1 Tax=Cricetulus griseus TaxID=10029 RepID=G3HWF0_CRIGR|nr:hypothetical protein I79_015307 [Cricetulus griseus]
MVKGREQQIAGSSSHSRSQAVTKGDEKPCRETLFRKDFAINNENRLQAAAYSSPSSSSS